MECQQPYRAEREQDPAQGVIQRSAIAGPSGSTTGLPGSCQQVFSMHLMRGFSISTMESVTSLSAAADGLAPPYRLTDASWVTSWSPQSRVSNKLLGIQPTIRVLLNGRLDASLGILLSQYLEGILLPPQPLGHHDHGVPSDDRLNSTEERPLRHLDHIAQCLTR